MANRKKALAEKKIVVSFSCSKYVWDTARETIKNMSAYLEEVLARHNESEFRKEDLEYEKTRK